MKPVFSKAEKIKFAKKMKEYDEANDCKDSEFVKKYASLFEKHIAEQRKRMGL